MTGDRSLLRWLVVAALLDWLVTRSLARLAIFMPKSAALLAGYQGLIAFGQAASVLCAVLALLAMGSLAWHVRRNAGGLPALGLAGLILLSLASLLIAPAGWMRVGFHALLIGVLLWLLQAARLKSSRPASRLAVWIPGLALLAGELYQAIQALYGAMGWPGPAAYAIGIYNLGEALALLSPLSLWWYYRREAGSRRIYAWAAIPALAFAIFYWLSPSMAGILAVWSAGLTLYLPWPAYVLSLWLASASLLILSKKRLSAAWALLLLAAGGYAPQLSTQAFLGLVALWLLAMPQETPAQVPVENNPKNRSRQQVQMEINS